MQTNDFEFKNCKQVTQKPNILCLMDHYLAT